VTRDSKGFDLLEQEILQAKAEALGRAGEKLERAVQAYLDAKATLGDDESARTKLAQSWDAVMRAREVLIVLREGIGLRRHDSVDSEYGIARANGKAP
jgi:hypothetical protein